MAISSNLHPSFPGPKCSDWNDSPERPSIGSPIDAGSSRPRESPTGSATPRLGPAEERPRRSAQPTKQSPSTPSRPRDNLNPKCSRFRPDPAPGFERNLQPRRWIGGRAPPPQPPPLPVLEPLPSPPSLRLGCHAGGVLACRHAGRPARPPVRLEAKAQAATVTERSCGTAFSSGTASPSASNPAM